MTAALLVAASVTLSGCSVPEDGWVGVGRASDGRLEVHLRTCAGPLDGATLYWADDPVGNSDSEVFGEWTFKATQQPGPADLSWPLVGPGEGAVVATRAVMRLPAPPKNMAIYAWTRDATTSASGPYQFTAPDLDRLEPGQVLVANNTGNQSDPPNKVVSRAAFDALDCADFN